MKSNSLEGREGGREERRKRGERKGRKGRRKRGEREGRKKVK